MTTSLGLIQINVPDRAAAFEFYSKNLSLPCREPNGPQAPFEVNLGNMTLLIYGVEEVADSNYEKQRMTLIIYTKDLKEKISEWKANGVEFVPISWSQDPSGIAGCPYGQFIALKDPFGNVFELLEPKDQ